MLTKKDFDQIENIIEEKLEEKMKFLPTKDEFFKMMDKIMGELNTIRQELKISLHRVDDHKERITSLEKLHPHDQQSL